MHIEVLEDNVDIEAINNEIGIIKKTLRLKLDWDQISLQGHQPNLNPTEYWDANTGKANNIDFPENYYKHLLFNNTPTINRYIEKYGLVRTRLMKSKSKTCLTWHRDLSKRIHIPVKSQDGCFMVIEDAKYFLEPGKVYLVNTTKFHTAFNGSLSSRVHIMGCFYS